MLLLDEPLTGLDLTSAQAIDQVIHDETATGCTIVMTTHDLAEAEVAIMWFSSPAEWSPRARPRKS